MFAVSFLFFFNVFETVLFALQWCNYLIKSTVNVIFRMIIIIIIENNFF